MELGNFGAILDFALQLEAQAATFYEAAAGGGHRGPYGQLIGDTRRRQRRLEQARREGVVEMVLEPVSGFNSDVYCLELDLGADEATSQRQAIALEDVAIRFYRDAAVKMPILGVARLFQRLAKENEVRKAQLEGVFGNR
jgi:hypothetical protein